MRLPLVFLVLLLAGSRLSAEQIVYPAEGQSPKQQQADEAACHTWAVDKHAQGEYETQQAAAQREQHMGRCLQARAAILEGGG